MVRQAPALAKRSKIIDSQKRIVVHSTNSYYQVLSAEAYSKHGINAHGILFDELHTQPDRELWDVLTTSQGSRRQPLIFVMTTAGYDRNSIGWEIHDYACKVRDGILKDPTFLPVIYAAPDDADWTDEDVWKKCNPALDTFRSIDEMRMLCARAKEIPALEMTFRRLYLNQWVNSVERWLPMDKWDACNQPIDSENLKGKICYAGLDLAATTDLTALSLVFPDENGSYDILMHFWIPGDRAIEIERKDRVPYREWAREGYITLTEGNVIDYDYILHYLKEQSEIYNIQELAFDRWGSQKLITDMQEHEFVVDAKVPGRHLVPFGQGYVSMSAPTKELMNLVLSQKIRHGGNPILRWNADNLVVTQDPAGNLKPDKSKATQKIDGMVALIMALDRATRHADDTSIYESRGILVI
jgi:phage terminase large subunit-like protein